jgi:peptidoglycan/LPS O-acetylase OafA/YrhL
MVEEQELIITSAAPLRWRRAGDWMAGKLSRVTSSGEFMPEIDGLRFLAIGSVIFHHLMSIYLPQTGRSEGQVHTPHDWSLAGNDSLFVAIAYAGHFGVNLFFAISGFILALPFAKRSFDNRPAPNLQNYFLRRVTRIEPPYLICLVIYFLVLWLWKGESLGYLFPHLLASMSYAHNLIYGEHSKINVVTWSLEIEIQFYILVPLLVAVFKLKNAALRRGLLLALIAWGGWLSQHVIYPSGETRLMLSLLNFFAYFLVGFLLADLYLHDWLARKHWSFDVLTVAVAWALLQVLTVAGHFYYTLPLLVLALFLGCFLGRWSNAFLRLRWTVILGGMCYTFYLYHIPLLSEVVAHTKQWASTARPLWLDFASQAIFALLTVLVLCSVWFALTEKPFMRWSLSKKG